MGLLDGMQRHKVLRVKVSKEQLNRALFVMDSLIRALEQRDAKFVKIEDSELLEIRIDGERIECLLIEETKRTMLAPMRPKPIMPSCMVSFFFMRLSGAQAFSKFSSELLLLMRMTF